MARAKAKAATIVSTGAATGASAKWAERLAAGTNTVESLEKSAKRASEVNVIDSSSDLSDFSYSSSSSYTSDASSTPIVATPVDYDSYSSSSASASLPGFTGTYDFEESYANREALMGGYQIDQAEVDRLYAELMPKDAGVPLPTVAVVEETLESAEAKFMEEASDKETATKGEVKLTPSVAAETEETKTVAKADVKSISSTTAKEETKTVAKVDATPAPVTPAVKTTSSSSTTTTTTTKMTTSGTKEAKKGGSKEAFMGFVDKVSSIKPEDVTKVVADTAKVVTSKESLDLAAKLANEAASKVQSSIKSSNAEPKSTTLPGGTRKVSSQDDYLSEVTMIKKKK
jgi:hypothetical protein